MQDELQADNVVKKVCDHRGDSESRRAMVDNDKCGTRAGGDSGLGSTMSDSPGGWEGKP